LIDAIYRTAYFTGMKLLLLITLLLVGCETFYGVKTENFSFPTVTDLECIKGAIKSSNLVTYDKYYYDDKSSCTGFFTCKPVKHHAFTYKINGLKNSWDGKDHGPSLIRADRAVINITDIGKGEMSYKNGIVNMNVRFSPEDLDLATKAIQQVNASVSKKCPYITSLKTFSR
jgi:ferredoxin